jgi:hypothetical protein
VNGPLGVGGVLALNANTPWRAFRVSAGGKARQASRSPVYGRREVVDLLLPIA